MTTSYTSQDYKNLLIKHNQKMQSLNRKRGYSGHNGKTFDSGHDRNHLAKLMDEKKKYYNDDEDEIIDVEDKLCRICRHQKCKCKEKECRPKPKPDCKDPNPNPKPDPQPCHDPCQTKKPCPPLPDIPSCEQRLPKCVEEFVKKLRCNPNECNIKEIVDFFYGPGSLERCPWYGYCDYSTAEIQLTMNDFFYADPETAPGPVTTAFNYKDCVTPLTVPLKLQYLPLLPSGTPFDDQECIANNLTQNPLVLQITVPDNYKPGSPLRLKLNLITPAPTTTDNTNLARLLEQYQISPTGTEPIQLPRCPDPEISALYVVGDSIHLCDIRLNSNLPEQQKAKCEFRDAFKFDGRSCDFDVFEYNLPTVNSFVQIQVQIDIFPRGLTQVLPQDLLVLYIMRTQPVNGSDTSLVYGVVSGSLEYSVAPENLSQIVKGIYDNINGVDDCASIIDYCLNSYRSCTPNPRALYLTTETTTTNNKDKVPPKQYPVDNVVRKTCGCGGRGKE